MGDNQARIVLALRTALARSDGVIVCGGLGPTHDDITRDAIAEVMNVPLVRDDEIVERIAAMFQLARAATCPRATAARPTCPWAPPRSPSSWAPLPGSSARSATRSSTPCPACPTRWSRCSPGPCSPTCGGRADGGEAAVIMSRVVRTWGMSESGLAELLAPRIEALDAAPGSPTIAFLASGIEGIKVRITAKAADAERRRALLDAEEAEVRALVGEVVFGVDDDTMEAAVAALLVDRALTLGLAESLTGGLVASRLVGVPGASDWFRGSVVSYASEVKHTRARRARGAGGDRGRRRAPWPTGARRVLGADVGLALTGVAGPDEQEGVAPGTVIVGLALDGPRGRVARLPPARRPRPGPPVRGHLRPRPAAPPAPGRGARPAVDGCPPRLRRVSRAR